MSVVGTAYVVVQAITKNLDKQIEKQVEAGIDKAAPGLEKSGRKAGDAVGDGIASGIEKNKSIDGASDRVGDRVSRHMFSGMRRRMRERTKEWSESLARFSLPNIREHFNRLGDRAALAFWSRMARGHNGGGKAGAALAGAIKNIPLPPIIPLLGLGLPLLGGALKVVSSYLAATVSLAAQLGPAVAAAGAVGASSFLALGTAMGAVMLAFKVQTPMLTRFKEVASSLGKQWKTVGVAIQKQLLPALGSAMTRVTDALLPQMRASLSQTGRVVGFIALKFAALTESPLFKARLANVMKGNNNVLRSFGGGVVQLADAAVTLLSAARPLTEQFGKWIEKLATGLNLTVQSADKTGRLAGFFERAGKTIQQLGRIFHSTFDGLADIFKAAAPSGQTLLDRIEAIAAKFSAWTSSLTGQSKLGAFFAAALPIVHEFNGLIGDVFKLLGEGISGNGSGTVAFIQEIRSQILPALVKIAKSFSDAGPGFSALLGSIGDFFQNMANSGALGAFTGALQLVFDTLSDILTMPILGTVAGWALSFLAFGKALSWIPGFGTVFKILGDALWWLAKTVLPILGKAIWALSKAFAGFLIANPWVAVVALIIGALVLAYNKFDWFRNFVDAVWEKIVAGALWVWDKLQVFWGWLANTAWPIIQKIGGWIGTVLVGYFQAWWGVVSSIFNFFVSTVLPILQNVWNVLYEVGSFVGGVLVAAFQAWWGVVSWVFQAVYAIAGKIIYAIVAYWQWLFGVVSELWGRIWNVISGVWNAVWAVAQVVGQRIAAVFQVIWSFASYWFGRIWAYISAVWANISGAVGRALAPVTAAWKVVYDAVVGIWSGLVKTLSGIWGNVATGIRVAFDGVKSFINDYIIGPANTVIDKINTIPGPDVPNIPRLARGGTIMPTPGGTLAVVAEAGRPERVEPLDSNGLSNRDYAMIEALSGSAPNVRVFIGDQELRGMVRVEVEKDQKSRGRSAFYSRTEVGSL